MKKAKAVLRKVYTVPCNVCRTARVQVPASEAKPVRIGGKRGEVLQTGFRGTCSGCLAKKPTENRPGPVDGK